MSHHPRLQGHERGPSATSRPGVPDRSASPTRDEAVAGFDIVAPLPDVIRVTGLDDDGFTLNRFGFPAFPTGLQARTAALAGAMLRTNFAVDRLEDGRTLRITLPVEEAGATYWVSRTFSCGEVVGGGIAATYQRIAAIARETSAWCAPMRSCGHSPRLRFSGLPEPDCCAAARPSQGRVR